MAAAASMGGPGAALSSPSFIAHVPARAWRGLLLTLVFVLVLHLLFLRSVSRLLPDMPDGMVGAVDPSVLPNTTTMSGYVQLLTSTPEMAGLVPVPRPTSDEGQNISYAVQWLLFAAVGIVGWIIFLRREAIEDLARDRAIKGASV